jgi:Integrase core domain/GAG-pre-integrase domain
MYGKFANKGEKGKKFGSDSDRECYNCHKKGHLTKDCWAKGGGKEGQGPKGRQKGGTSRGSRNRSNHAMDSVNDTLPDIAYMANTYSFSSYDWMLDSCTTSHICNQREAFVEYSKLENATVQGVGNTPARAIGQGTVVVNFAVEGKDVKHRLRDVLHVPEAGNSLLSVSRFDESSGNIEFRNGTCMLYTKGSQLVGMGKKHDRLYRLDARAQLQANERANLAAPKKLSWDAWHRLYGHIGMSSLETLKQKELVDGLEIDESTVPSRSCEACIQAKQHVKPFPKEADGRSRIPGEQTFSDVWGPARVKSIGGAKYFISFIDDAARTNIPMFLKTKGEATSRIKQYVAMIEKRHGRTPKYLRFDNGRELVNKEIESWAAKKGIIIETTAPYSPSQHGTAERFNRTLLELARAMLIAKGLPAFLWTEAVAHAAYIRDRSPTKALDKETPYETWTGK